MREEQPDESIADESSADPQPAAAPTPDASAPGIASSSPFGELNDRPHMFDERGYQVSIDRQFWWNGGAWVLGQPPGSGSLFNARRDSTPGGRGFTAVQA